VAVQAFDAGAIKGRLGIRAAEEDEPFEGRTTPLAAGTLVVADEERPVSILFGAIAPSAEPGRHTERVTLAAVRVKGVPDIAIEEALWLGESALRA
jgi:hypothetical protein